MIQHVPSIKNKQTQTVFGTQVVHATTQPIETILPVHKRPSLRVIPTMTFQSDKFFWHVLKHFFGILSGISCDTFSRISSDILSGVSSDILSGVSSDILSGVSSDILAFYLAYLLTRS